MTNKWDLNDRDLMEVEFCQHYKEFYHHGTPGHQRMLVVAKLAEILNQKENEIPQRMNDLLSDVCDNIEALYETDFPKTPEDKTASDIINMIKSLKEYTDA